MPNSRCPIAMVRLRSYERFPNFFYCLGRIWHLLRDCMYKKDDLAFGGWLRAHVTGRSRSSRGCKFDPFSSEAKQSSKRPTPNKENVNPNFEKSLGMTGTHE
ncbi:hypothetical protein ACOSQ4_027639 [Xanthoceras sorbifolium]